jgi:hypothetical protein
MTTYAIPVKRPDGSVVKGDSTFTPGWDTTTTDASGHLTHSYQLDDLQGVYVARVYPASWKGDWTQTPLASATFTDPAGASSEQCANGGTGNPVTLLPCSSSNWIGGNANSNKAHWQEGDFVAYREIISGISEGSHTLILLYQTASGGKHAIDYLGSFDTTETTSASPSPFHANNNNPCADVASLPASQCTPAAPVAQIPVPPAALGNPGTICGTAGTFAGAQVPGAFKMWGPPGSSFTDVAYLSQNVSAFGACTTTMSITFFVPVAQTVVIAWGGHIASQADWGAGNSASFINGSPYHMSLGTLDGAPQGSQDLALSASAVFFTPTITTAIQTTTGTVTSVPVGTTVFDTATLAEASAHAGGTVVYSQFNNGTCSGSPATTQSVSVSNGIVPPSSTFTPTVAGAYSYQATYSGDDSDVAPPPSACESLTVSSLSPDIATTVKDAAGNPVTSVPFGTSVHDTANLSGGFSPITGTVTYNFFTSGSCTGASTPETVTIGSGNAVPDSAARALVPGSYSYQAHYSRDTNNQPADSACEPFSVGKTASSVGTIVLDAATELPPVGTPAAGSSFLDTATVTGGAGVTPTGTVTYSFFRSGGCTAPAASTQTVTLSGGTVPNSATTGPLLAGNYSFQATYSGDGNYNVSTSACEPLGVGKTASSTATQVINNATGVPPTGTEKTGTAFHDTAKVTGVPGIAPTGTVTYSLFPVGDCTGSPVTTQAVPLESGATPNSSATGPLGAGSYSFQATYNGDANYASSTACEPFSVTAAGSSTVTQVIDDATGLPPTGNETAGSAFHDTATVTGAAGVTATGSVIYTLFTGGSCTGIHVTTQAVGLAGGGVPGSRSTGPLGAGSYSYQATYSGDANYASSIGVCEPFTISKAPSSMATHVFDTAINGPWTGAETTGASAFDSASVTGLARFTPTGTATYRFFPNGSCSGPAVTTQPVGLIIGFVPNSATTPPLAAGAYSFQATYNGDGNYTSSTSACEPFSVVKASPATGTLVLDAATSAPWTGTETTGASALDTATVTGVAAFFPTGTLTSFSPRAIAPRPPHRPKR